MKKAFVRAGLATVIVGGVLAGSAVSASASTQGWRGACSGDDWVVWDGKGSYMIWHGKCA